MRRQNIRPRPAPPRRLLRRRLVVKPIGTAIKLPAGQPPTPRPATPPPVGKDIVALDTLIAARPTAPLEVARQEAPRPTPCLLRQQGEELEFTHTLVLRKEVRPLKSRPPLTRKEMLAGPLVGRPVAHIRLTPKMEERLPQQ